MTPAIVCGPCRMVELPFTTSISSIRSMGEL
jgi:hypothetical protein